MTSFASHFGPHQARISPDASGRSGAAVSYEWGMIDLHDSHGRPIERLIFRGDADHLMLAPQRLIPAILAVPCGFMLLRHWHPSGLARPSKADIAATRALAALGRWLNVPLHDHIIEAAGEPFSFRANGLI